MKKSKLLGSVVLATGLFAAAPLATLSSCAPGGQTDEKIVTLDHINLSYSTKSVFQAGKLSTSNESEDEVEPTLWETKIVDDKLVMTEVTGEDKEGQTVTVSPDWTKQIDNNHLILSFSNNDYDEGNVQYCVNLSDGKCTKLEDFWIVQTIDDHDFAFQARTIGGKSYIYFVATYANFQSRQIAEGGGIIRVEADYFDTFDKSKITKVTDPNQWVGTMVRDKGKPVAHHFSVNTKGDVLYYCSTLEQPSSEGFDNKWGLLYNEMNEDGTYTPENAYKLFYETSNGKVHCSVMAIYNQGEQFFYKDEGNGIIFSPKFTEFHDDTHEYYVDLTNEMYLNPNAIYGILTPYSRHIVRTTYTNAGNEKIVNIDNGHIIDLYTDSGKIQKEDEPLLGYHHARFEIPFDYVDYTNSTAFFLTKGGLMQTGYFKPTLYCANLNKKENETYQLENPSEISGETFDINNLQITSLNVLNDKSVLIGAYDNVKSSYVTIEGKYESTWTFELSKEQYTTPIDQFELIQSNL